MSDVMARLRDANPVNKKHLAPSVESVWRQLEVCQRPEGTPASQHPPTGRKLATGSIPSRRMWRRSLVLGVAVIAVALAVVIVEPGGGGPARAFAAWRAIPTAPAKGQVRAAESACDQHGSPTLTDTRGRFSMLIYAHRVTTTICISGLPSTLNPSGRIIFPGTAATPRSIRSGRSATLVPQTADVLPTRGGDDIRIFTGQVRPDVTGVTLTLDDGSTVRATTENDWFAAWWPSSQGEAVTSARLSTATGTITRQMDVWGVFHSRGHGHTTTTGGHATPTG
jgi:hypothetical protein